MLVIPAIDIKEGKCVRLLQGDPQRKTIYSDDPVGQAKKFEATGAGLIHVVDLDGAFEGKPVNLDLVASIAAEVSVPIEIGGGIRSAETVRKYLDAGIRRIIIGSAILEKEFDEIIKESPECIIAGIDARDSMVATQGWREVTRVKATDLVDQVMQKGVREIIYTDIATDGMLSGPNMEACLMLLEQFPRLKLIASGGVSSLEDIEKLKELESRGLKGAIVGKAIYDGRVELKEVIKIAS